MKSCIDTEPINERTKKELIARFTEMIENVDQYPIYDIAIYGVIANDEKYVTEKITRELIGQLDGSYEVEDETSEILEEDLK